MNDPLDPADGGTPAEANHRVPWSTTWPYAVAGLLGPVLTSVTAARFPLYLAFAGSFFVLFFIANWISEARSGRRHRFLRNLFATAAGAAVGGLFAYLLPWG